MTEYYLYGDRDGNALDRLKASEKDFSGLIGLRDRMVRDENPNFHPFRLRHPEEVALDAILANAEKPSRRVGTHPE
jgi:hypothetical protein